MDRWIRHFARVMGMIVCFIGFGLVRTHQKYPDLIPIEIAVLGLISLMAVFVCCVGIILSDLPLKNRK